MSRTAAFPGRRLRPAAVLLACAALAGWAGGSCGRRAPAPAPAVPCTAVQGELAAGVRADALAGDFRLVISATGGARAGESASGALRLRPYGDRPVPVPAVPGVRHPFYGGTDVELARVGAAAPGSVENADPARPGVLVLEWPRPNAPAGTNEITLRLGADANQGGEQRFDGTFMALSVTALSPIRFTGTWRSGGGDVEAGGYFCADRQG